jgi:hypothetical protein
VTVALDAKLAMLRRSGSAQKNPSTASAPGIGDVARLIGQELIDAIARATRHRLAIDCSTRVLQCAHHRERRVVDGLCRCSRSSAKFSRAGSSSSDLIAQSEEEFECRAIGLATNPDRLGAVGVGLAKNRLMLPLFDASLYMWAVSERTWGRCSAAIRTH